MDAFRPRDVVTIALVMMAVFVTLILLFAKADPAPQTDECMDIAVAHGISCVEQAEMVSGVCECRDRHNHVVRYEIVSPVTIE